MLETQEATPTQPSTAIELEVESLSSAALARLIEEVSNPTDPAQVSSANYNRTHHRHNR